ncbi:hypothetical protein COLO4_19567 [Corchorus olitorius]|uniref:Uncharacterized protein n=1 Tax=Corchorus olitorius TaxID=93759 RepID=A0A1R3J4V0_9ROSI|nr:hypothetical protein COLO4_19567 [Corchorus olitorius]
MRVYCFLVRILWEDFSVECFCGNGGEPRDGVLLIEACVQPGGFCDSEGFCVFDSV